MKIKGFRILIATFVIIVLFQSMVFASTDVNPFSQITAQKPDDNTVAQMNSFRNKLYTVFQIVGTGIAVASLMILGIKYVSSAPNERAELKKYAVVYIVGAVLFFGAIGIVEILKGFGLEVLN